ncbi:phage tail protein [Salmonella enterica]|nr:phage tail protein [Salmonella enterica]
MHTMLLKDGSDHRANVESLIEGHHHFLERNTGRTDDATRQHYIFNPEGVVSNNRHFIAHTMMEYQPNGDAPSESQSLLILGEIHAYLATKEQRYLDKAIEYFNAYVKYYYEGDPIPDTPRRWIANWLCNGKEPVLASFPINPDSPTQGGYKNVPVKFVNGKAQIPHGSPFWGEYLDVATWAHRGHMAWPAINGGVRVIKNKVDWDDIYNNYRITTMPADPWNQLAWIDWPRYLGEPSYTVDWSAAEPPVHLIEYIVAWTNNKIGVLPGKNDELWGGEILETGLPNSRRGEIQLRDHTVNGVYLLNYAVKLPVEHGGYLLKRNEVWHNRPVNVPLYGELQRGNAADAELWFCDCCYMLWRITNEQKYYNAWQAVLFTLEEYIDIDKQDQFFRQDTHASSPFTDGISYDWSYPELAQAIYSRDENGYIVLRQNEKAQSSLEQQAVWFKCKPTAKIRTEVGGKDDAGQNISVKVEMYMNREKVDVEQNIYRFVTQLPALGASPANYDIPLSDFVAGTKPDGSEYILADIRSSTDYGNATIAVSYRTDILDNRRGNTVRMTIPDSSSGAIIGFWLLESSQAPLNSLTYTSTGPLCIKVTDAQGWSWVRDLPAAPGWVTQQIRTWEFRLASYQENTGTPPASPQFGEIKQFSFVLPDGVNTSTSISWYCVNDVPPRYNWPIGYTIKYRLTFSADNPYTAKLGDCTVLDYENDNLAYTPGVIPFSNIYNPDSKQFDGWHGIPYPGYQYPFVFTHDDTVAGTIRLNNMVNFLYDSQQWYYKKFGQLGPGASAFIWNRWDNFKYGVPDTFTMYHWGNGSAWSGYQPRAYFSAARGWYELVNRGKPVPSKLIAYVDNWSKWLLDFMERSGGVSPSNFPQEGVALPVPSDFTGHMCGLWLAGAAMSALCGSTVSGLDKLMDMLVNELEDHYDITGIPGHVMDGGWSPALRLETGTGPESNAMYYGFYSGEILRGLGLYLLYKNKGAKADIYDLGP